MTLNRRQFLALAAAVAPVRAALGEVRFVRIEGPASLIKVVERLLRESGPRSVTVQHGVLSRMAILRYRRCVVSYESRRGSGFVTLHGDRATLRVSA